MPPIQRHHRQRKRLGKRIRRQLLTAQQNEITEHAIYSQLAERIKGRHNRQVLLKIAEEEKKHAGIWRQYTGRQLRPRRGRVLFHTALANLFGFTFAVKFMEKGEELAQVNYEEIANEVPEAGEIKKEEEEHEHHLLNLLDEEKLRYMGSMVLGVNDALVELTGALAGLTLALQNTSLIALTGLITGIAAALSMGASEYLSTKAEEGETKDPIKASLYTGVMYLATVIVLIAPYYLFDNLYVALGVTLLNAVVIILLFTFYISVARDLPFKKRFFEMAGISLGVSLFTFGIGYFIRSFLGLEV